MIALVDGGQTLASKLGRHTGEGRCPSRKWIPAFRKALAGDAAFESSAGV
jgi:hypothetical protein